jgi:hypothetical protein
MRSYKQLLKKARQDDNNMPKKIPIEKEEGINKVFRFMTPEEQNTYLMYSMCGMHDYRNNVILMGSAALERMENYEKEMIAKYDNGQ